MKIACIGEDIPFLLPTLLTDLLFACKEPAELCCCEPKKELRDLLTRYGGRVIERSGLSARVTAAETADGALAGADAVIYAGDCMPASRFQMDRDALSGVNEDDPGLLEQARVNGGLGGLMHTLRAGDRVHALCDAMDRSCPKALVIHLAQPTARVTAMFARRGYRVYGLGRSPMRAANGVDAFAKYLGRRTEEIAAETAGLPGFAFVHSIRDAETGEDLLPKLTELAEDGALGRLTRRWLDWWGAVAVGDVTDHAEFLPAQEDYLPEEQPIFSETVEQRKRRILCMNTIAEQGACSREGAMAQVELLSKAPPVRPIQLALALLRKESVSIPAVTRVNQGELPQLADAAVIETPLTLERGESVIHGWRLADALAETMAEIDETNRLAALAASGDRAALRECIETDPALAGLDRLYVLDAAEHLIDLHRDVLRLW